MYIVPNSTLILLRDCPLDETYDHTIYFNSQADQYNYFYGLRKFVFTGQSYTRVNRGYVRLEKKSDDLYDCNYLMFQNTSYGNKWFYAFITSVEYVNDEVCEVRYEIDHLQTWHFDYTLKECFVEREHSATDVIGENLVPEGLEQGEYTVTDVTKTCGPEFLPKIVVVSSVDMDLRDHKGEMINRVYSGLNYLVFNTAASVNEFILRVSRENKLDAIQSIFMCPFTANFGDTGASGEFNVEKSTTLYNYSPRNKKLLTYPYQLLHVHTDTNSADFKFEFFSGSRCQFNWVGYVNPTPSVTLLPINYNNDVYAGAMAGVELRLTLTDFPQCAWTNDVYTAWLAQNTGAIYSRQASSALSALGGLIPAVGTKNPVSVAQAAGGGIVSITKEITSEIGQRIDIASRPAQANGAQTALSDFSLGAKSFFFKYLSIRPEFAAIIDDFFDMFGYATHRVKVPNRNVRPHWTYTKTKGCIIVGGIPADASKKIISIYNNGITFWKNGNEVGNYSLDNRV